MKLKHAIAVCLFPTLGIVNSAQAESVSDTVDVNLSMKHVVGTQSQFDRNKYLVFHDDVNGGEWESEEIKEEFLVGNDLFLGRNNGGIVWEWNNTKEDPNKPGWPDVEYMKTRAANTKGNYANKTAWHTFEDRMDLMMIGGQEFMFPHGQATRNSLVYENMEATAEFYAHYLKEFFADGGSTGQRRPLMLEVINEPFVKAGQLGTTNAELSEYHNIVAKRVKALNPDVMVGGYTAAHPAFESGNFNHWKNCWKLFIDTAGENMDFFSFHLYDVTFGDLYTGTKTKRAGSNIEAIMDMINHYSVLRLGETKPFSVSEYGWFVKADNGDYDNDYDPFIDWSNIRSFNNMMLQLLERPEQIVNAIPFVLNKALWAQGDREYNNYQARLMREIGEMSGEEAHGGYIYTDIVKYYQFWKEVKGTRIDTKPTDFDLLSDAYVDGNKMYLIFSNLDSEDRTVHVNLGQVGDHTVQSIEINHLYAENNRAKLEVTQEDASMDEVVLKSEATMILEYTFDSDIAIDETNTEKDYFANKYLQPITGSKSTFGINQVELADQGEAMLRIGLGRNHGLSLKPSITVNGTKVAVPVDWKGYDQKNRDSFFGVLEVPVPYELLEANNSVSVQFSDNGGFVTSVILKAYTMSTPVERSVFNYGNGTPTPVTEHAALNVKVYPNPTQKIMRVNNPINEQVEYKLYNAKGAVAQSGLLENGENTLNLEGLASGMYMLKVNDSRFGEAVKVVKQ